MAAPKSTVTASPSICLRKGDILAANGKVIRKKTIDARKSPSVPAKLSDAERFMQNIKRQYDDRWGPGRSSLHRRF